jgi:hypothetical protein
MPPRPFKPAPASIVIFGRRRYLVVHERRRFSEKQRLYPLPTRGDWTFSRQDLLSAGRPEFVPDPDTRIRPNTTWGTREEEDRPGRISFELDEISILAMHSKRLTVSSICRSRIASPDAVQSDLLLVPFGIYVHIYATHAEDTEINKRLIDHDCWISRICAERNLYLVSEGAQSLQ